MATWFLLAIAAQFLSAVTVTIDKFLVSRSVQMGKPLVLTFYIAVLSSFVLVLVPFGVSLPTQFAALAAIGSGIAFVTALYFQFAAFQHTRVSDAAPVIGAVSVLTTLALAYFWIDGDVSSAMLVPILFLILGIGIISRMHFAVHALRNALIAGLGFGCMFFCAKLVFNELDFMNGFFWTRMASVGVALTLLVHPAARAAILHGARRSSGQAKGLLVVTKVVGSSAGVLTALAVSLGSVSVVNALSGIQFVFLFFFALLFTAYIPRLKENSAEGHGGWHTLVGVISIAAGLAWLAYIH